MNRISWVVLVGCLFLGSALAGSTAAASRAGSVRATAAATAPAADCQPFAGRACLLPFPNNLFTRPDASSRTGLRVNLPAGAMPKNTSGQRDQRRAVRPRRRVQPRIGGDRPRSGARQRCGVHEDRRGRAGRHRPPQAAQPADRDHRRADRSPPADLVGIGRERQDIADHRSADPRRQSFVDSHTYVVALRNLRTATGQVIRAPKWFEGLRDNRTLPANERPQRARYARIFAALARAGVRRSNLYEAWDFTVASRQNVTGRLLSIRNAAFAGLGDRKLADGKVAGRAPKYTITSTKTISPELRAVHRHGRRSVLPDPVRDDRDDRLSLQLAQARRGPDPASGNVAVAPFECIIPSSAGNPLAGARVAVRARAVRRLHRGRGPLGGGARDRAQHGVLWDRLVGPDRPGRVVRRERRLEPEPVSGDRRPPPAGRAEHVVPRSADDQSGGPCRRTRTSGPQRTR